MAEIRSVTPVFAVAGQVRPEEVPELGRRFAAVINNRPDGEDAGQPTTAEMEAAAVAAGLAYRHIPITGAPTVEQVRRMQAAVGEADGPVLAFCRTGTRSIVAWALGQALEGRAVEDLTAEGRIAGYDLTPPLNALLPSLKGATSA